jgi:hypothetical protein
VALKKKKTMLAVLFAWSLSLVVRATPTIRAQFQTLDGLGIDVTNTAANQSTLMNTQLSISFSHEDASLGTDDNMAFQATTQVFDAGGRLVPARLTVTFGVPKYTYTNVFLGNLATHCFTPSYAACTEQTTPFQARFPAFQSSLRSPDLIATDLSGLTHAPEAHTLFAHVSDSDSPSSFSSSSSFSFSSSSASAPRHPKFQAFDRSQRLARFDSDPHIKWHTDLQRRKRIAALQNAWSRNAKSALHQMRLLALAVVPPLSGEADFSLPDYQVQAYQRAASVADAQINRFLAKFKTNEHNVTEQMRMNTNFSVAALQAINLVVYAKNQTLNYLNDIIESNNKTLDAQAAFLTLSGSINQTTQQALSILQDAQSNATTQLHLLDLQVSSSTYSTLEETNMYQGLVTKLKGASESILSSIAYLRSSMDAELETVKLLLTAIDQYRLDKSRNRLQSQSLADLTDAMGELGLQPFVSLVTPVIRPLGFVPIPPNTLPYFLVLTLVYTFKAYPGSAIESALYPDPDVPADSVSSLPLDAQNAYNNLMLAASQEAISNTFVNLRSFGFQCNRDFLLEKRDMFVTAYNFINMIGPPGCTPGVNCTCWVVVHSERCATAQPFGFNDTSTIITSLSQVSGLCADNTDLQTWFNPSTNTGSDVSPTQLDSSYNLTSSSDFLAVLRKLCQITLVGTVDPNDPITNPGNFLLHTSSFEISPAQRGRFLLVPNKASLCSTNHIEMEVQSVVQGIDTLVYAVFLHMRYAAGILFQKSSSDDEVAKYGSGAPSATSYDQHPYHTYTHTYQRLAWEEVDQLVRGNVTGPSLLAPYLTHVRDCEVSTLLFTGPSTYPVWRKTLESISQEVQVSLTYADENGVDQTTTYTTDKVRRTDVPTNPLPDSFLQVGSDDCIWNLCNDYSSTFVLSNYVVDLPPSGGGILSTDINEEARRNTVGYVLDRAPPVVEDPENPGVLIPPYGSDSNYIFPKPVMTQDEWLRQNNKTKFEPRYATVSPSLWKRHLIQDSVTGYPRCDPDEVSASPTGEGLMCSILRQTRRLLPSDLGALLDQQRTSVYAPLEWKSVIEVSFRGTDLHLNPPLRLVCPDPNLVKIDTSSLSGAAGGGSMATFQYKNTHSYPVLGLLLLFASNDVRATRTPRFTATTYGLASGIYLVNATENPTLVLPNVSCTRVLAHLSFGYERISLPLPLPTTCNNQNLAIRFYSVDVTGLVPTSLLSTTSLVMPTAAQLLTLYQNATATPTLAKQRVQLCWQNLGVNLSDVYQRQKNLFYNGDVRSGTTAVVNSTTQSLLGIQVSDLRNYTLSSISHHAAAAVTSASSIFSSTSLTQTYQSVLTTLLLFNESAAQWLATQRRILTANNAAPAPLNQSSNLTSMLNELQALWVSTQKRQQITDRGPVQSTTTIPALQSTASAIGAALQAQWEQQRILQEQAATYSKLVKLYIEQLNLTLLVERLNAINETTQRMVQDMAFLELVVNHTASEELTNIDNIFAEGGGAPEFGVLTYDNTFHGNSMFEELFGFATETALRIGTKIAKIGENIIDLIGIMTEPDKNCFLGLAFMCKLGDTLRWVGIAMGGAVLAGVIGFIIYKSVTAHQAAQVTKAASGSGGPSTGGDKEVKKGRVRRKQKYHPVPLQEL